ncbi:protein FAM180A [Dunckerocampus dactyliophorus]|uniref:protein FAM180A n=1 Tax=Dunckerocampus dactyliophorus TaxID=161453 RepID=UPI002406ADCD|nr:protein FAM180A [Dunckerocampus dactyliophorus]
MLWKVVLLISLSFILVDVQYCHAALYPSALRTKRGTPRLVDPSFQHSVEDAKLLFEILLTGMEIRGEEDTLLIQDPELASLRRVRSLAVICEDVLPKRLSEIKRLTAELDERRRPLSRQDFERTVLTLVYAARTVAEASEPERREAWARSVIQLFRAIQKDLAPSSATKK